jgi:two-component sensor histidine kinase
MNQYSKSNNRKIILISVGLVFVLIPLFYSDYLAKKLRKLELTKVEVFERTLEEITNTTNLNEDMTYEQEMLEKIIADLPVLTINRNHDIELHNFEGIKDTAALINDLKSNGPAPLESEDYTIYYQYPMTLTLLSYFPLVQLFLLILYAGIGYAVFNASRKEEQNRVWVGMAKETAHQLGTPISGILGWIENLRLMNPSNVEQQHYLDEMEYDAMKLQMVADRFSKIGSLPELKSTDLVPVLTNSKNYIAARASKKIQFQFPDARIGIFFSAININLFSWVIENLLRNALDAMSDTGTISCALRSDEKWIYIDLSDTGKGIPSSQWKHVFKPGFTTKTRGWGLGLSLSRRIIENYHEGKIFIKQSEPGKGTTFTIQLPLTRPEAIA